jgi:hypothetical protein
VPSDLEDLARAALVPIQRDLAAASLAVHLHVGPSSVGGVRVEVNGGYSEPSLLSTELTAAVVELAGYVQEWIAQDLGMWPSCRQHGFGLHPRVEQGRAVWFCPRAHVESAIGARADRD